MAQNRRGRSSPEFKFETVQLVADQGYVHKEAADAINVGFITVDLWIKKLKDWSKGLPGKHSSMTPEQIEIKKLEKKLERASNEKEILYKSTAAAQRPMPISDSMKHSRQSRG